MSAWPGGRSYAIPTGLMVSAAGELAGEELASLPEEAYADDDQGEELRPDQQEQDADFEVWEQTHEQVKAAPVRADEEQREAYLREKWEEDDEIHQPWWMRNL